MLSVLSGSALVAASNNTGVGVVSARSECVPGEGNNSSLYFHIEAKLGSGSAEQYYQRQALLQSEGTSSAKGLTALSA